MWLRKLSPTMQAENFGRASQIKHQQAAGSQGSLVSLDADPCWDAFGTLRDAEVPNGDATGPGSPSRRVPGPQEEFIKATKSNIESVKVMLWLDACRLLLRIKASQP